jgi:hypothetical protein
VGIMPAKRNANSNRLHKSLSLITAVKSCQRKSTQA